MHSYIYLLREREFFRLNEDIYKIGKTEQEPNNRLAGYPKGTEVVLFMNTRDCHTKEGAIIDIFKKIFIQRTDVGKEYFEGNRDYMVEIICDVINVNNNNPNNKMVTNNYKLNGTIPKKNSEEIGLELNIKIPDKKIPNIMLNIAPNKEQREIQYNGKQTKSMKYNCDFCNYETDVRQNWYLHKNGKKHKKRELKMQEKKIVEKKTTNDTKIDFNENINLLNKSHEVEMLKQQLKSMETEKNMIEGQLKESKNIYEKQLDLVSEKYEKQLELVSEKYEKHIQSIEMHLKTLEQHNQFQKQLINSTEV